MIKITSGYLKNKSFHAPDGLSTRPTSSKVREALFNILGSRIEDSTWLDLFSGSGSIGFEAISRYAKEVTFIENEKNAFFNLKKNIELLDLKNKSKLFKTDSIQYISKTNDSYDFIFIDPPYNSNLYEKSFEILNKKNNLLNDNGLLIHLGLMQSIVWQKDNTVKLQPACLLQEIYADFLPT